MSTYVYFYGDNINFNFLSFDVLDCDKKCTFFNTDWKTVVLENHHTKLKYI
jgi:hypothetical protein